MTYTVITTAERQYFIEEGVSWSVKAILLELEQRGEKVLTVVEGLSPQRVS